MVGATVFWVRTASVTESPVVVVTALVLFTSTVSVMPRVSWNVTL